MGQTVAVIIGFVVCVYAIIAVRNDGLTIDPQTQNAAVLEAVPSLYNDFSATGTIVFYPNNVGPVPYLFYQDANGHSVSKAIVFQNAPPSNFSSWTGARVSVVGHTVLEHVVVRSITYLSSP